jgi:hypothetical protein
MQHPTGLRDLLDDHGGLSPRLDTRGDVGLGDDAEESALAIHHRDAPHPMIGHQLEDPLQLRFGLPAWSARVVQQAWWQHHRHPYRGVKESGGRSRRLAT